jgi:hypothetical protein
MTTRGEINSNFYQIVDVDTDGAPTLVKPEYIGPVSQVDADISNVHISGGTNGYVLQTDGTGNLSWTAQTGGGGGNGVPGGSNTQVQFNDAGVFGGADNFTYDKITNVFNAENITGNTANLGNLYVEGNIQTNTAVYVGYTANLTGLTNPTIIAKAAGATYVQAAVVNGTPEGSADYVTYGDNGSDSGAWADMGFTGSNFSDPLYTITGINDGYFFVLGDDSSAHGGNLVIATGQQGFQKDIIFATGGFLAEDEKMRYKHAEGQFFIQPNTVSSNTTSGALVVTGGAGIGGNLNVAGNVSGDFILGDGGYLSNVNFTGNVANANYANFAGNAISVQGGNVTGNVGNAVHAYFADVANSVSGANVTGNVGNATHAYVADVANSVSGSNVTGNVSQAVHAFFSDTANSVAGANVSGVVANANYAAYAGNATVAISANSVAVANVVGIGNIATTNYDGNASHVLYGNGVWANIGANISANFAAYAGNVTVNSQPNITSVGTLTSLTVTGNISGNVFTGNGSGLSSITGANVTGVVANATNAANAVHANVADSANSVAGANVTGNVSQAVHSYFSDVANSVSGGNVSGQVANALVAGTVYTNAQPNITSVGSLTGLTVSNATGIVNFTTTANVTLGGVANLHITGGTTGQYLSTNGSGVLTWSTVTATPAGSNTEVQYNNSGSLGASNSFVFTNTSGSANLQLGTVTANSALVTFTTNNISGGSRVSSIKKFGGIPGINGLVITEDTRLTVLSPEFDVASVPTVNLGDVANVHITGGTANYFLQTDGSGSLSWAPATGGGGGSPGGPAQSIQFNNYGLFDGTEDFTLSLVDDIGDVPPTLVFGNNTPAIGNTSWNGANLVLTGFGGDATFVNQKTDGLTITKSGFSKINFVANTISMGSNANINITGGTTGQVLTTDGAGNLSWTTASGSSSTDFTPSFLLGGM